MMNPIRNIERSIGAGGPERGFDPARHRPHSYPANRKPRLGKLPKVPAMKTAYDEGGEVDTPDPMDLREPDDQLSPHDAEMKQVVTDAMAALRGEGGGDEAIQRFIDVFGEEEFEELQQMVSGGGGDAAAPEGPEAGGPAPSAGLGAPAGMQVGGLLRGPGTGQSDEIDATTPTGRKVLLSDGEYVVDAATVSALGDGSTDAGARRLDQLRKAIRQQAYGHDSQAKRMRKGGRAFVEALNS